MSFEFSEVSGIHQISHFHTIHKRLITNNRCICHILHIKEKLQKEPYFKEIIVLYLNMVIYPYTLMLILVTGISLNSTNPLESKSYSSYFKLKVGRKNSNHQMNPLCLIVSCGISKRMIGGVK